MFLLTLPHSFSLLLLLLLLFLLSSSSSLFLLLTIPPPHYSSSSLFLLLTIPPPHYSSSSLFLLLTPPPFHSSFSTQAIYLHVDTNALHARTTTLTLGTRGIDTSGTRLCGSRRSRLRYSQNIMMSLIIDL